MKYILLSLFLASCAHTLPSESTLRMLASFDLSCLPDEIELVKIDERIIEARCNGKSRRYLKVCLGNVRDEKSCTWIKMRP